MCGGPPPEQWFDGVRENADLAMERAERVFKKARLFYERPNETKRFKLERAEKAHARASEAFADAYDEAWLAMGIGGSKVVSLALERQDRTKRAVVRSRLACERPEELFGKATKAFMRAKRTHETAIEVFNQRQGDFFVRAYC